MLKANNFDRDGCRTLIVWFTCQKMKAFLFSWIISEKIVSCKTSRWGILHLFPCSDILGWSINFCIYNLSYRSNPCIDNIYYLLQSLDKQSLRCTFYISGLIFSLLQIHHKPSFLLVSTPTQTIFPTRYNPKKGNLRYVCSFSSSSIYSSEDNFQVHGYQLLFIYVIKIQL